MMALQDCFVVGDVDVFPDVDQDDMYYVAPQRVHVVRNSAGAPIVSLMYFGGRAALTLETAWSISLEERQRIVRSLLERDATGQLQRNAVDLRILPVPVSHASAQLVLIEAAESERRLAETTVNTFGTLHATFSAALSAADGQRFQAALTHQGSDAVVRYDVQSAAALRLRVSWELPSLVALGATADASPETLAARVAGLAAAGRATITTTPEVPPPDRLRAMSLALAQILGQRLATGPTGSLRLTHEETFHEPLRFTPSCSLSTELAGVLPSSYVVGAPGGLP